MTLALLRRLREATAATPDFEQIERLCQGDVYRYALRRLSCRQDAEDIARDVFVAAHEARWQRGQEARPYLLGIARRKVIDRLRQRTRRPETPLQELSPFLVSTDCPQADALRVEAIQEMRALLLGLPELQREALLLQVAEELPVVEIAQVMGKSPSAVNSLLGRAREAIRLKGSHYFEDLSK